MIIEGNELQLFDLIASYAQRYQCSLVYFDLLKYNALSDAKKTTVNAFYADFIDDYVLDIMKQGTFNTIKFLTLMLLLSWQHHGSLRLTTVLMKTIISMRMSWMPMVT